MYNNQLVSVIIPVYNCDRYLAEAIESILSQTYQPFEVIVIDDGSADGSAEVAKHFDPPVRYYYQSQSGAGAARNYGVSLAKGSFLAFLDADDLWVEDKLARQMQIFDNEPEVDMVFGHVQQFHSPELDESIKNTIHCPAELMAGYIPGTMLIKRDAFLRVGEFETNLKMGEFISWYMQANELGMQAKMLPEQLMWRRLHQTNTGIRERQSRTDYVRVLKASLDRRRANNNLSS